MPDSLRRRPHRSLIALNIGNRARASDRSVHLVRMVVGGLHHGRGRGKFFVHVLGIHGHGVARRFLIAQMIVKSFLLRQLGSGRPRNLQRLGNLHGLPGFLRDYADKILFDHHFHESRHFGNRAFVHIHEVRAHGPRANHHAMQHAGHAHVVRVLEGSRGHLRHIRPPNGLSEHGPLAGRLAFRGGIHFEIKFLSGHKFGVGHFLRGIAL